MSSLTILRSVTLSTTLFIKAWLRHSKKLGAQRNTLLRHVVMYAMVFNRPLTALLCSALLKQQLEIVPAAFYQFGALQLEQLFEDYSELRRQANTDLFAKSNISAKLYNTFIGLQEKIQHQLIIWAITPTSDADDSIKDLLPELQRLCAPHTQCRQAILQILQHRHDDALLNTLKALHQQLTDDDNIKIQRQLICALLANPFCDEVFNAAEIEDCINSLVKTIDLDIKLKRHNPVTWQHLCAAVFFKSTIIDSWVSILCQSQPFNRHISTIWTLQQAGWSPIPILKAWQLKQKAIAKNFMRFYALNFLKSKQPSRLTLQPASYLTYYLFDLYVQELLSQATAFNNYPQLIKSANDITSALNLDGFKLHDSSKQLPQPIVIKTLKQQSFKQSLTSLPTVVIQQLLAFHNYRDQSFWRRNWRYGLYFVNAVLILWAILNLAICGPNSYSIHYNYDRVSPDCCNGRMIISQLPFCVSDKRFTVTKDECWPNSPDACNSVSGYFERYLEHHTIHYNDTSPGMFIILTTSISLATVFIISAYFLACIYTPPPWRRPRQHWWYPSYNYPGHDALLNSLTLIESIIELRRVQDDKPQYLADVSAAITDYRNDKCKLAYKKLQLIAPVFSFVVKTKVYKLQHKLQELVDNLSVVAWESHLQEPEHLERYSEFIETAEQQIIAAQAQQASRSTLIQRWRNRVPWQRSGTANERQALLPNDDNDHDYGIAAAMG